MGCTGIVVARIGICAPRTTRKVARAVVRCGFRIVVAGQRIRASKTRPETQVSRLVVLVLSSSSQNHALGRNAVDPFAILAANAITVRVDDGERVASFVQAELLDILRQLFFIRPSSCHGVACYAHNVP